VIEHAKANVPMRISFRVGRLDIRNGTASWKMFMDEGRQPKTAVPSDRYTK
jgi:hypothetical protein